MKSKVFILASLVLAMFSLRCTEGGNSGLTISGAVQNAGNLHVYLDKAGVSPTSVNKIIVEGEADAAGNFKLAVPQSVEPGLYRLRIGEQQVILPLDGKEENITVNGELSSLQRFQYQVTGAQGAQDYVTAMQGYMTKPPQLQDVEQFVQTTPNPMVGMVVAIQLMRQNTDPRILALHQGVVKKIEATFPGNPAVADYNDYLTQIQKKAVNPNPQGGGDGMQVIEPAERKPAPDISLPSPDGKKYALSDLKGKVVLLDFWASWCGPCRRENPSVVGVYNKYKDKGFTVFSVSLDGADQRRNLTAEAAAQNWKAAIEKDGLLWKYHVSDLKGWSSDPAQLYGVNSIPRTFMLDKDGKIAAVNLRGAEAIEQTLLKLL